MAKEESCPLCETSCTYYYPQQKIDTDDGKQWVYWIECPVCGKYAITTEAKDCLRDNPNRKENRYIISSVTRNLYESGEENISIISGITQKSSKSEFMITAKMLRDDLEFQVNFLSKMPKSVLDKAALLMQYIGRKSGHPGDSVLVRPSQYYPLCFCKNAEELTFYIDHLSEDEDIKIVEGPAAGCEDYNLSLTAEGWRKIESLTKPNLGSKQTFVAMYFDESLKEIFTKGISLLEEDTGFKMYRVDQEQFNEKICDRIIADIRKSRFLIADVTGLRHAVFFEAGYAMGLGLPVIFTCKEGTKIEGCFDTRQYNHIIWENAEDLKSKLKDRILATIGRA
ncbi:MAG: hypothetical protein ABSF37_09580 [Sedimentisphaerales bacterium]|jgi:nucleoside 2-deoxyribosyltransferase